MQDGFFGIGVLFIVIQIAAVGTLREMYFNAFVTQRVIEEKKMGEGL